MTTPRFLPYAPAQESAVIAVFRSRVGTHFESSEEADLREYLAALAHPERCAECMAFWTLWLDDGIVGCGGIEVLDDCAYLCWGIIDARYGGRGLGSALLRHRLAAARERGARSLFADTTPQAEGFYARHGFETYHRAPNYWGGSIDLAAMEHTFDGERRGPRRVDAAGVLRRRPQPVQP